jgi:DNA-binding NarL/FixJ family response regulator
VITNFLDHAHPWPASTPAKVTSGLPLTPREAEILDALVHGQDIASIAEVLVISVATTRTHIRNLHLKTNTHTLIQLASWGREHGKVG